MAFRLDISDMERHKVDIRLACNKAMRRFALANMSDVLDEILTAHLSTTNASNQQEQAKNQYKIPSRFTPDESEKLAEFLFNLISHCQDASQRELLQESLRRALVKTRDFQRNCGAQVDPMCLFCMGMFSQPQIECPPNHGGPCSSTPLGDMLQNNMMQDNYEAIYHPEPIERAPPTQQELPPAEEVIPQTNHNATATAAATEADQAIIHDHSYHQRVSHEIDPMQQRAQEPVDYQPTFNIPPTPDDEDTQIDDNQDNEPNGNSPLVAAAAASSTTPPGGQIPVNGGKEDSFHSWFLDGSRRGASGPLASFIDGQRSALNNGADGDDDDDETTEEDEQEAQSIKRGKVEIFNAEFAKRIEIEEEEDLKLRLSAASSCARSQPVSSLQNEVRRSIKLAQQTDRSSATQAPPIVARERVSNSKQFIKHRKKRNRNRRE